MNTHTTSLSTATRSASKLGSFMSGFGKGAFNGGLMMGIFSVVGLVFTGAWPLIPQAIAMTMVSTGLFSGIMGVRHAAKAGKEAHTPAAPVKPTNARSAAEHEQQVSQDVVVEHAAQHTAPTKSWADRVGHGQGSQSRVDEILANGSLTDKSRAAEIAAAREAAVADAGRSL